MSTALDAFSSLIADSIQVRATNRENSIAIASNAPTRNQGKKGNPIDTQQQIQLALAEFHTKVARDQDETRQRQRLESAKSELSDAKNKRKRRFPTFIKQQLPNVQKREWTIAELSELSYMVDGDANDGICSCTKRRKISPSTRTIHASGICCFERLQHISEVTCRTIEEIEQQIQLWSNTSSDPTQPNSSVDAPSIDASLPSISPDTIESQWNAAGDVDRTCLQTTVPRWSPSTIMELMSLVRDAKDEFILERKRIQDEEKCAMLEETGVIEEKPAQPEEERQIDDDIHDLPLQSWSRLASALHPPQLSEAARAVYFSVLDSGGYIVPSTAVTQPPFYFPSQFRYAEEIQFEYDGPSDDSQPTGTSDHDDDGSGQSSGDDTDFHPDHSPEPEAIMKEVRKYVTIRPRLWGRVA